VCLPARGKDGRARLSFLPANEIPPEPERSSLRREGAAAWRRSPRRRRRSSLRLHFRLSLTDARNKKKEDKENQWEGGRREGVFLSSLLPTGFLALCFLVSCFLLSRNRRNSFSSPRDPSDVTGGETRFLLHLGQCFCSSQKDQINFTWDLFPGLPDTLEHPRRRRATC